MTIAGQRTRPGRRLALHLFLVLLSLAWLAPLVSVLLTSLRPYRESFTRGYFSRPFTLNVDNYRTAWEQADFALRYWNTALILVPALILTLFASSVMAFVCSRFSWRFNVGFLLLFAAGGLLPQQIIIQPLFLMYKAVPLPEVLSNSGGLLGSTWGIIMVHVAYQSGFCTFILSGYMKRLPAEISEAAIVDGANPWQHYWRVILPLCRPVLAALTALEFTWIYNDFFWALILEQQFDDRPITSSLTNLAVGFSPDFNVISAASALVALPPIIVFVLLQRYFTSGLGMGLVQDE
ncbi:MAG: carbohydrate ABC transporter permease [Acidimicrobiales bacterium]|nr:carbohydrate ABC transporter permease [Acidimicrobiales bacterium]